MSRQALALSNSVDAEASVLGAILLRADVLDQLELRPEDFHNRANGKVFEAMRALRAAGKPVDTVTVPEQLGDRGDKGLLSFLAELVDRVPTVDNVAHYAAIVADQALKRRIALLLADVEHTALAELRTGENMLTTLRERLARVSTPKLSGIDIAPMSVRLAGERAERLEEAKRIIPFEVSFLDDLLGGIHPKDLIVLTAKPGAGKTQLASTMAENAARAGRHTVMFALEAEPREIERRMKYRAIARVWNEPSFAARRRAYLVSNRQPPERPLTYGAWRDHKFDELLGDIEPSIERALVADLGDRVETVYRNTEFSLEHTERVMQAKHEKADLFILDHLHYVDTPDEQRENEAVEEIMGRLRDLVLRYGKPVIVISHLRKEDAFRETLLPRMRDLHGSSAVPKIATAVVALAPAPHTAERDSWHLAPTYMQVLKDRRDGIVPLVAQVVFDKSLGAYRDLYELGIVKRGKTGEEWERIEHLPYWAHGAKRARQPELF
jgi:replicative DNA helicase